MVPEELLEPSAGADEAHAQRLIVAGCQGDALNQGSTAVLEPPGCGLGLCQRHQELDTLRVRRAVRQQAERDPEPARRAPRRAVCIRLGRLAQHRHRRQVAMVCGVLDVVRACGSWRAARGQRVGAALVCG